MNEMERVEPMVLGKFLLLPFSIFFYAFSDDTTSSPESPSSILGYVPSLVTPFDNSMLDQLSSIEEVREAVFSLGRDNAPGLDGFSGAFFTHCWDIISTNILKSWTGKLFSMGGRLTLIKHVLQSIPMYILATLDPRNRSSLGLKDSLLTFHGAPGKDQIEGIGCPRRRDNPRPYIAGGALHSSTGEYQAGFAIALGSNGSNSLVKAKGILYGLKPIIHVYKEANQVADALANFSHDSGGEIHFINKIGGMPAMLYPG
ncbi:hypothetical protein M9H77_17585 [Catharanthus roseus]|uniref:Uncharacterized protein n=1 Tax=Catharanthus roseus TaxID=4058 RepID=A0ACC0B595_CATRO|nr:hypothetical protein M9H77_17585 [Catharanthus roseus]